MSWALIALLGVATAAPAVDTTAAEATAATHVDQHFVNGVLALGRDRFRITSIARSSSGFARIFRVRDEIQTIVDREKGEAIRRRPGKPDQVVPVSAPVFDPLSLIYQFRRLALSPGDHVHFYGRGGREAFSATKTPASPSGTRTMPATFPCASARTSRSAPSPPRCKVPAKE